jgi:hypothetical protein
VSLLVGRNERCHTECDYACSSQGPERYSDLFGHGRGLLTKAASPLLPDEPRAHTDQHCVGKPTPNQVHQDEHVVSPYFIRSASTCHVSRRFRRGCEMASSGDKQEARRSRLAGLFSSVLDRWDGSRNLVPKKARLRNIGVRSPRLEGTRPEFSRLIGGCIIVERKPWDGATGSCNHPHLKHGLPKKRSASARKLSRFHMVAHGRT